ncbi:MAG: YbaK/EbsC family protein [Lachnospiraceae bacterium]|nr:YbaK/EbsC family protein [Lachnospiraceae bacterium]
MSIEKAKNYLKQYNLDDRVMEFSISSATVKDAAIAVGCAEDEIAKSLTFLVNDEPIMILTSGNSKIDNAKYKSEFHTKAKMIPFEDVEKYIGYAVGGICPFGINDNVKVYLDVSLKKYDIVYPAAGTDKSAVKLTIAELENTSKYIKWIDVCKINSDK